VAKEEGIKAPEACPIQVSRRTLGVLTRTVLMPHNRPQMQQLIPYKRFITSVDFGSRWR
jgi:hypothetical protein